MSTRLLQHHMSLDMPQNQAQSSYKCYMPLSEHGFAQLLALLQACSSLLTREYYYRLLCIRLVFLAQSAAIRNQMDMQENLEQTT